jgi:hypothetical protein
MRKDEERWNEIILIWPTFGLEVQSQGQEIFFKNGGWGHPSKGRGQPRVDPVPSLVDTEPNNTLEDVVGEKGDIDDEIF